MTRNPTPVETTDRRRRTTDTRRGSGPSRCDRCRGWTAHPRDPIQQAGNHRTVSGAGLKPPRPRASLHTDATNNSQRGNIVAVHIPAIIRVAAVAVGFPLCWGALFLYETEHRLVQSRLEDLWIRIDDLRAQLVRRHIAFLRVAALAASRFLDSLFGRSFLSLRFFGVSACFSLIALLVMSRLMNMLLQYLMSTHLYSTAPNALQAVILRAWLAVISGDLLNGIFRPDGSKLIAVAFFAVFAQFLWPRLQLLPLVVVVVFVVVLSVAPSDVVRPGVIATAAIVLGVASDVLAFVVIQTCLRWQAEARSTSVVTVAVLLQIVVAVLLLAAPLAAYGRFGGTKDVFRNSVAIGSAAAFVSNTASVILALAVVLAAFTLVIHRVIWPFIARPLYLLTDLHVFATRKGRAALLAVGGALVAFGLGGGGTSLLKALQAFVFSLLSG